MNSVIAIPLLRLSRRRRIYLTRFFWISALTIGLLTIGLLAAVELEGHPVVEASEPAAVSGARGPTELDREWQVRSRPTSFDGMYGHSGRGAYQNWIRNTGELPPSRGGR